MDLHLSGKLALVSGSTKGLDIATSLAREGAKGDRQWTFRKIRDVVLAKIRQTIPDAKLEGFTGNLSDAIIVDKLVKQFYGCTIR